MVLRASVDMPIKAILEPGALERLGIELASMGARRIGVVADRQAIQLCEFFVESLRRTAREAMGTFLCEALELSSVENAAKLFSDCDTIVSIGGWLASSLSMYLGGRLGVPHVAVSTPPGVSAPLERVPVPLKGMPAARMEFERPKLVVLDSSTAALFSVNQLAAEVAMLSAKGCVLSTSNLLAGMLARDAIAELKRALDENDVEELYFAAFLAGLSSGLLRGSATSSLARAMHALYGADPLLAEMAIFPCWLMKVFERWGEFASRVPVAVRDLEFALSIIDRVEKLPLERTGMSSAKADLVVEYAWTYEHYSVAADPVIEDKLALRELLIESIRRQVRQDR